MLEVDREYIDHVKKDFKQFFAATPSVYQLTYVFEVLVGELESDTNLFQSFF